MVRASLDSSDFFVSFNKFVYSDDFSSEILLRERRNPRNVGNLCTRASCGTEPVESSCENVTCDFVQELLLLQASLDSEDPHKKLNKVMKISIKQ